jgi:hypothetical protein
VTVFLFKVVVVANNVMVFGFVLDVATMRALDAQIAARLANASVGTAIGNIAFFATARRRRRIHRRRAAESALPDCGHPARGASLVSLRSVGDSRRPVTIPG